MKQQNIGSNGNRQKQKIPLFIDTFHQQSITQREDDAKMQQQRWPDQRDFIATNDLWMDFPVGESVSKRSRRGQGGVDSDGQLLIVSNRNEGSEHHQNDTLVRFESEQTKLPLHSSATIDGHCQREKGCFFPPHPAIAGEASSHHPHRQEVLPSSFQTKYVNVMFSAYSIKGWGNNDPRTSFPCHQIHAIKQPTLLTLSSFPFRIVYANDALLRLRGTSAKIVGVRFFDCFDSDELLMKPCLSKSDILLRLLLNGIRSSMQIGHSETSGKMPCFVKAYPVVSYQLGAENVIMFAMRVDVITT